ncbi:MAG: hypothetical protein Q9210_004101 [Variospora velana]
MPKRKTPTQASTSKAESSSKGSSTDVSEALDVLQDHGLYLDDEDKDLPPNVAAAVQEVLSTSFNPMRSVSAQKIIKDLVKNRGKNEKSVLGPFWNRLLKDTFLKSSESLENEWADQGLSVVYDQQFKGRGVSALNPNNPDDKKVINAIPNMQHPKPDALFGIHRDAFSEREAQANTVVKIYSRVSKPVFHAFLLVEDKGVQGSIEMSEVQALRGGSTLVAANRMMKNVAGMLDLTTPGTDASNIAFSFCVTVPVAKLYVHFAEVVGTSKGSQTRYHMKEINAYFPKKKDYLKSFRLNLEQILDWGTLNRLTKPGGVNMMLQRIMDAAPDPKGKSKAAKSAVGTSAGAASREDAEAFGGDDSDSDTDDE